MYKALEMSYSAYRYGCLYSSGVIGEDEIKLLNIIKKIEPCLYSNEDLGKYCEFDFDFSSIKIKEQNIDEEIIKKLPDFLLKFEGNYDFLFEGMLGIARNLDLEFEDEEITSKEIKEYYDYTELSKEEIELILKYLEEL